MKEKIEAGISLFENYKLEEAQSIFDALYVDDPKNIEILIYLGKINTRTQNYGDAMNFYNKALEIDPKNEQANTGIQLAKNILQLTNNFYFENAYTDDGLYEQ